MKKQKGTKTNKKELEKVKNQLMRALADYDNLRKRIEREREEFEKIASVKFAVKMLTVFDMIEEAQRHLKDSGIALTLEEFKKILEEEGIEKIQMGQGDKFDEACSYYPNTRIVFLIIDTCSQEEMEKWIQIYSAPHKKVYEEGNATLSDGRFPAGSAYYCVWRAGSELAWEAGSALDRPALGRSCSGAVVRDVCFGPDRRGNERPGRLVRGDWAARGDLGRLRSRPVRVRSWRRGVGLGANRPDGA